MEFKFIETNGITLRAAVEGEGPLVLWCMVVQRAGLVGDDKYL